VDWIYALITLAAVLTAAALSRITQRRSTLTISERIGLGIGAFCGAMLGAKAPFLLLDPAGLRDGSAWLADGKTIMCGLVGGYFGVELAKWALDIKAKTGDSYAMPVAAGIAVGRLGCLYAGCCYGTPTDLPWGVTFTNTAGELPRHPTQLYEFLFHASAAIFLYVCWRRRWFEFQQIKLYIIAYLVYRFFSEWLRPEPVGWRGLSLYQWLALLWIPIFVALWVWDDRRRRAGRIALAEAGESASTQLANP